MIEIQAMGGRHVAYAPDMEGALLALRTCVEEEGEDLKAVGSGGVVLAWAFTVNERPHLSVVQGARNNVPGVRGDRYSADWL